MMSGSTFQRSGELLDMIRIGPVAEGRQVTVRSRLAGILGGGLAVHLQDAASRASDAAENEVDVVDLARCGCGLVRLIDSLKAARDQPTRDGDHLGGAAEAVSRHPRDCLDAFRWITGHDLRQHAVADRVLVDEGPVHMAAVDQEMLQAVEQSQVCAELRSQMKIGLLGGWGLTGIDHDELGRVRSCPSIEDAHPEHGVGRGNVVADMKNAVSHVDIFIGAGLAVRAEGLLQGRGGGCGAQPRVAVHVRRAETSFADDGERIILLEEELS